MQTCISQPWLDLFLQIGTNILYYFAKLQLK